MTARSAADVRAEADGAGSIADLDPRVVDCFACPRLVAWREQVAHDKRKAYESETYWGRPVPGFGATDPRVLVVGLAPAAHGANRTGRMFTGDRSGEWLYAALHRAGLASQPVATSRHDGLELIGARITAPVHCAPPDNKPTIIERDTCAPWLRRELALVWPSVDSIVTLGAFGWDALWRALHHNGTATPRPRPRFGHGAEVVIDGRLVIGCYHVSQQNTFTGRLTEPMLDAVFTAAVAHRRPTHRRPGHRGPARGASVEA